MRSPIPHFAYERVRLTPEVRKGLILTSMLRIARHKGLANVTHGNVASNCPVQTSRAIVEHHYPNKKAMIEAVIAATDNPDEAQEWGVLAAQWGLV